MATFRIHGMKALIIQHFNNFPDITLMEFEWDYKKYTTVISSHTWPEYKKVPEIDQCHNKLINNNPNVFKNN